MDVSVWGLVGFGLGVSLGVGLNLVGRIVEVGAGVAVTVVRTVGVEVDIRVMDVGAGISVAVEFGVGDAVVAVEITGDGAGGSVEIGGPGGSVVSVLQAEGTSARAAIMASRRVRIFPLVQP